MNQLAPVTGMISFIALLKRENVEFYKSVIDRNEPVSKLDLLAMSLLEVMQYVEGGFISYKFT